MTAWYQRCCHRGKAIVQGLIGHTEIAPKAFFNAIDPNQAGNDWTLKFE